MYCIIILLLAEYKFEFRMFAVDLFMLWFEEDEYPVLKEVIKRNRVGVETLTFKVVDPEDRDQ